MDIEIEDRALDALKGLGHETPGFLMMKGRRIVKAIVSRNTDRRPNRFRVSAWSRILTAAHVALLKYDGFALFHVHEKQPFMSRTDVDIARVGSLNAIVVDGYPNLWLVARRPDGTKVPVPVGWNRSKSNERGQRGFSAGR